MKRKQRLIKRYLNIEFGKNSVAETRRSIIRKQRRIAWILRTFFKCEILKIIDPNDVSHMYPREMIRRSERNKHEN